MAEKMVVVREITLGHHNNAKKKKKKKISRDFISARWCARAIAALKNAQGAKRQT